MKIKGTAVKSLQRFVKIIYPQDYDKWLESLAPESKRVFDDVISVADWYNIFDAQIQPIQKIGEMFYGGDVRKAAYELGVFGAKNSLKGIYKIFVSIASKDFILKKATSIFSTYFSEGKIEIEKSTDNEIVLRITEFKRQYELVAYRIKGWVYAIFDEISSPPKKDTMSINITEKGTLDIKICLEF